MTASKMRKALSAHVIEPLELEGFEGAWPHFRRVHADRIDLLSFQLDKRGGGFVVEVASAPPKKIRSQLGDAVSAKRVNAQHMANRFRLAPRRGQRNHWYRYEGSTEAEDFSAVASKVMAHLARIAAPFWAAGPDVPRPARRG